MKYLLFFTILPFLFTPRLDPATNINKVASVKPVDKPAQIQISDSKPALVNSTLPATPVASKPQLPSQSVTDPANTLPTDTAQPQGPCAGYPNGICESCTIGQCGGKDAMTQSNVSSDKCYDASKCL